MTRDDVIAMATEAGLLEPGYLHGDAVISELERFAALVAVKERETCGKLRSGSPRRLSPVGTGSLLGEQQYCFDKGWREGARAVRVAILARSNGTR